MRFRGEVVYGGGDTSEGIIGGMREGMVRTSRRGEARGCLERRDHRGVGMRDE